MLKHTWLGVLVAALLLTGLTLWLPPSEHPQERRAPLLPWTIEVDGQGGSRAFDLELGRASLADAERLLGEAKLTLFRRVDGRLALEAFFDDVRPGGLLADFVLALDLPDSELETIYARGLRIARGTGGVSRVALDPVDLPIAHAAPIAAITYLPAIELDPETLERRFGLPEDRVAEGPGRTHWLYPALGLDIVVDAEGKEVFQYVAPRDFERLAAPLREAGRTAEPSAGSGER